MAGGVMMETVADMQKKMAKMVRPGRYVDTGLYRLVRCPNYLGELIIWTGSFVVCFGACCTLWQWVIASVGYVGIVYVMFSGARRLEMRQTQVYGDNPGFQAYVGKTPLLLPIYSLERCGWLKA